MGKRPWKFVKTTCKNAEVILNFWLKWISLCPGIPMRNAGQELYAFEGYTLDLSRGCLRGASGEIELRPKSFELLRYLIENAGRLVSKDELVKAVWPNVIVGDDSLAQCISDLRHALSDSKRRIIKTVPRRGYLFAAPVQMPDAAVGQSFSGFSDGAVQEYSTEGTPAPGPRLSSQPGQVTATRRLTAILAADVVGYSRLIGVDEGGTLRAFKAMRADFFDPAIAKHNGRLVKTTGDGLLVEFGSVVDALQCATQLQEHLAEHNESLPTDKRIDFRMGIHQGDVVVEDGDLFGDGVNVAVRLEGLAEPGGICVSARVQEDAVGKLDLMFEDLGERQLKNISRPIRIYRVSASGNRSSAQSPKSVAPRLSIVVLPFANLSSDPEQDYFVDGITEDLTTDISRIYGSFVIARNTAFTYKGKPADVRKIGRELGVRYALEGSVRRSGDQLRVNAQLIDCETGAHLWADRINHSAGDLFTVQDEITRRIAVALNLELTAVEASRSAVNPDAFDCILRARAALWNPPTKYNYVEAIRLLEQAVVLDPNSVDAQAQYAAALAAGVLDEMSDSVSDDIARAERLVSQALAAAPRRALPHYARGEVLRAQGRPTEAISEFEAAISFNRNWVTALAGLGWCKFFAGSFQDVIPLQEQLIRLSPRDPEIGPWYFRIGRVHLVQSRINEAVHWLEKAVRANADHPLIHAHLASAYALSGDITGAASELAEARRLSRDNRYASINRLSATGYFGIAMVRTLFENTYFVGLRKAGMPESKSLLALAFVGAKHSNSFRAPQTQSRNYLCQPARPRGPRPVRLR